MKKLAGFLAACLLVLIGSQSSVIAQTFTKGDIVEVYNTGGIGLRVRNAPCGDRIGNEPDGSIGIILEGPVYCVLEGTGYYWWRIRWSDGMQGWSAQNWLRKLSLPSITSASPSPSTIPPGGTVTLTYNVTNPGKEIGGAIAPLLGASIQLSGGGPVLSDPANDRKATIRPGSSSVSRPFVVPATAAPGTYDLLVSLVADVNNNGRIDPEDRTWDLKVFPRVLQVRVTCTYSIFPTSQSFSSAGGSGSVNVTAPSGCPWTATSNASWITITSGSSGNGNGTVNYSVASNPSTTPRTGTMTIAGQTFIVTQSETQVTTRTLTVASSNPNSGVFVTINPNDNNGRGSGTTPFTLTYNNNTVVTLTAPPTAGGNNFQKWQRNGVDWATTTTTTVTMDADYTMVAVYVTQPPPAGVLSVTPSEGLSSSGPQGGPFNPSSKTYTLTNTGGSSINWSVSKSQAWVSLSKTSGMLAPGASDTLIVSINSNANSLTPGSYSDTVTFTNTTNGNGNTTRSVSLTITPVTTGGTIKVNAKLDGRDWSGSVSYWIIGPQDINVTNVPATFPNMPVGRYTFDLLRGFSDPPGATLAKIESSDTQTLEAGKTITFTLNFVTSDSSVVVELRAPWEQSKVMKPQTYYRDSKGHGGTGLWNAVDFYATDWSGGWLVLAAHDGTAEFKEFECGGALQSTVIITGKDLNGREIRTRYTHLIFPRNLVGSTKSVKAGDVIGVVRRNKNEQGDDELDKCQGGPHLHFAVELKKEGAPGCQSPSKLPGWSCVDVRSIQLDGTRLFQRQTTESGPFRIWSNEITSSTQSNHTFIFILTVTKNDAGSGEVKAPLNVLLPRVVPNPQEIVCKNDCRDLKLIYSSGTSVTLTATPATGSTFAGWSGACSGTGTCTVTMDANKTVTATFTSTVRPPAAPNQLRVRAVSSRRVDLSWNDRSNNEDGFRIYRNGSLIATVGANTTSYSDTTVRPRTSYCYQVAAYNAAGEARSSRVCKTTPQSFQLGTLMVAGILIGTAPNGIEFAIDGQGVSSAQVEVFDLKGRKVFDSGEVQDNTFTWNLQNNAGQRLANGVYLYVVRVRGFKGEVYVSEVRKLVILR
jgi:hypothetical protein